MSYRDPRVQNVEASLKLDLNFAYRGNCKIDQDCVQLDADFWWDRT